MQHKNWIGIWVGHYIAFEGVSYWVSTHVLFTSQEVLREAGFVASNSEIYPLGGIVAAIQNAFHATPELECSGDAVEELRLCFYKDFKVRQMHHTFWLLVLAPFSSIWKTCFCRFGIVQLNPTQRHHVPDTSVCQISRQVS